MSYTRMAPIDLTQQRLDTYLEQGVDRVVVSATGQTLEEQRTELSTFADRYL